MNRKYKLHPGRYEIGENEKFYGDMEARGWRLVKRGAYFSRFESVEPSSARYRIEVFQPGAWAERDLPEEQVAVFEDCGWEYVCSSLPLHIFRAPAGSGAPEFYNDPAQQAETLKKMKRDALWGWSPTLIWLAVYWGLNGLVWGSAQTGGELRTRFVQVPALFLAAGFLILGELYRNTRSAWIITRTYRRLKKGIPMNHAPKKSRTVHRTVNGFLWALVVLFLLLLAAQLITTRSTDLPEETEDPYLLLSDLGWEELHPSEEETSVTHTRSLLADYWDTMERDKGKWNGDPWMYQDVYRLRDDRMADWLAEALMKTATFGDRGENFVPIEAEGLDAAWTSWREEVVAVKGNLVAYIIYLPGTSTDFDPQTLCAALAEKWAVEP